MDVEMFWQNYIFYSLLAIIVLLGLYHIWFINQRHAKLGNKMPGYAALPLIGNLHIVLRIKPEDQQAFIKQEMKKWGKVTRIWMGPRLGVMLLDPRDVQLILGSSVHIEKTEEYNFFQPWLGDGVLISNGEKWRSHRKLIAPTFHQSILKTFVPTFNANANELVKKLQKEAGKVLDIHDYMGTTMVNILLKTIMGIEKTPEDQETSIYAKAVMNLCYIIHLRQYLIHYRPNIMFRWSKMFNVQKKSLDIVHKLVNQVLKQKEVEVSQKQTNDETNLSKVVEIDEQDEEIEKDFVFNFGSAVRDDLDEDDGTIGGKKRLPFLEKMLETSNQPNPELSRQDMKDEMSTLLFEGHDTTASASSFFLCVLGAHQDIQEKVYQELYTIFQGTNRPITFYDTLEMKYLERVLLETLRMYPPVPLITRNINEDVKLVSGDYTIPAGAGVGIAIYGIHRDPDYYPDPEKFDPDRFLPENVLNRPYFSFIPFSAGPRSCVGRKYAFLKLKILLATLVLAFKIKSVNDQKDFHLQYDIILKRIDGFKIVLEERNKTC